MDPKQITRIDRAVRRHLADQNRQAREGLAWLREHMHPYFFITMGGETEVLAALAESLQRVAEGQQVPLVDSDTELVRACPNTPGSVYRSLRDLQHRVITYAEITHSYNPVPGGEHEMEIQRFEFRRKDHRAIAEAPPGTAPVKISRAVRAAMKHLYPVYDFKRFDRSLRLLWLNNENYLRVSPPERVARLLWLYQRGRDNGGLYVSVEDTQDATHHRETRVLFSVGNPPDRGFLAQSIEVFNRLGLGVRRAYCLDVSTGLHPYFLGTFYVTTHDGKLLEEDSDLFRTLKAELYNTQILATESHTYQEFVAEGVMTGVEATLVNAFIAFAHTNLAHNQPDRFDLGEVKRAFYADPELALSLVRLFQTRFDPDLADREDRAERLGAEVEAEIEGLNTGHRHLDEIRKTVYRAALVCIRRTLKTNAFVPEKHALAFRLDPAYLQDLGAEFTADLPAGEPFRITYFFGRHGAGYHVGFSDIARGGWRTIICRTADDFVTNATTLLREVYVLAHTQHLKNKDIYEGGSKLGVVLDTTDLPDPDLVTQRLYKLQFGFLHAFLDLFVTENGLAAHPCVVDYYGEDEPIELGPDENMHDAMIELVAKEAVRRGYILGKGIMSSKEVGINHKEYGVTSLGVVRFAEITLASLGIDMGRDPFSVKITGGPNGDVAGNAMRLLLERCPNVQLRLVVAGSGVLVDPEGIDRDELGRIVLKYNVDAFAPEKLHPGGAVLLRKQRKKEGLRTLYKKLVRTADGVEEQWVTTDEFNREFDGAIFEVDADLFLPGGGRPETIDGSNWQRLFTEDGNATCRAIVEGANSFITPEAREQLQRRGIVLMRDASANKCGVISSSYEIQANLLMDDATFLCVKDDYVRDVLAILERRAEEEARLILERHAAAGGARLYTEISAGLSHEINAHYRELFDFFRSRPDLVTAPALKRVILAHMPRLVGDTPTLRRRIGRLPEKIRCAILAVEIATRIVYRGGWGTDLEQMVKRFVKAQPDL